MSASHGAPLPAPTPAPPAQGGGRSPTASRELWPPARSAAPEPSRTALGLPGVDKPKGPPGGSPPTGSPFVGGRSAHTTDPDRRPGWKDLPPEPPYGALRPRPFRGRRSAVAPPPPAPDDGISPGKIAAVVGGTIALLVLGVVLALMMLGDDEDMPDDLAADSPFPAESEVFGDPPPPPAQTDPNAGTGQLQPSVPRPPDDPAPADPGGADPDQAPAPDGGADGQDGGADGADGQEGGADGQAGGGQGGGADGQPGGETGPDADDPSGELGEPLPPPGAPPAEDGAPQDGPQDGAPPPEDVPDGQQPPPGSQQPPPGSQQPPPEDPLDLPRLFDLSSLPDGAEERSTSVSRTEQGDSSSSRQSTAIDTPADGEILVRAERSDGAADRFADLRDEALDQVTLDDGEVAYLVDGDRLVWLVPGPDADAQPTLLEVDGPFDTDLDTLTDIANRVELRR